MRLTTGETTTCRTQQEIIKVIWLVVSNVFYFHPYLGKIPNLTHIFQVA